MPVLGVRGPPPGPGAPPAGAVPRAAIHLPPPPLHRGEARGPLIGDGADPRRRVALPWNRGGARRRWGWEEGAGGGGRTRRSRGAGEFSFFFKKIKTSLLCGVFFKTIGIQPCTNTSASRSPCGVDVDEHKRGRYSVLIVFMCSCVFILKTILKNL
jgi:hypothetical protein